MRIPIRDRVIDVALFLAALFAVVYFAVAIPGCVPVAAPPKAEVIDIPRRTCERWYRFDPEVEPDVRQVAEEAAAGLRGASNGRIRIAFGPNGRDVFHVIRDSDRRADKIDVLYGSPTRHVLGLCTGFDDGSVEGRVRVEILLDRVRRPKLWHVIAHELGHGCGLFDLDEEGNVMSGYESMDSTPVAGFGPADIRELRARGFY